MSDILDFKRKKKEFFKRWDLVDETNSFGELVKFGNRLFGLGFWEHYKMIDAEEEFYLRFGINKNNAPRVRHILSDEFNEIITRNEIDYRELKFWFLRLEVFISLVIKCVDDFEQISIKDQICSAIGFSDINLSIKIIDNEVIFFPKGEEELDKKLVDEVLSFLDRQSQKHFIDALKFYQKQDWIKSCEIIRRAIEEFLRFKFSNNKGLKENILEIGKLLKSDSTEKQIRNMIVLNFQIVDRLFNEGTKHNDGNINEPENEFVIYQAGVLMRYINKIYQIIF